MANKKNLKKKQELGGDDLKMSLLKDDTFKKYLKIVSAIKDKIDLEELEEEMMRLHEGRISRTLYGTNPGGDKIMKADQQNSSYRSRLATMYVRVNKQADLLDIAMSATRVHLAQHFRDEVDDLKTKGERIAFFDNYLTRGVAHLAKMRAFLKRLDTIIKDIDQAGFMIQHSIDVLELIYNNASTKKGT